MLFLSSIVQFWWVHVDYNLSRLFFSDRSDTQIDRLLLYM